MRGCRRTGGTRVPVTIRSYHVYFLYESTRASSGARVSFLAGDSHQPPSSPQATQGLRSPELTREPVSVCVPFPAGAGGNTSAPHWFVSHFSPSCPKGGETRPGPPVLQERGGGGLAGGGGCVTHSARATSAVSSRNCFLRLVHTSFTVCWSRPTCQKRYLHMHKGLGCCLAEEAATARQRAGWGGRRQTLASPQGKARRPGTQGVSQGGEGWSEIRWTKRRPQTRSLSPASCGEAPGRGADAQPWGRRGRGRDVPRSELPRWVARGAPSCAVGLCQLQILHSPTHSQVHCKKRPLPPGMASPRPLREETPMPVTLSGLFSLPLPPFLRLAPLSARTRPCPAT